MDGGDTALRESELLSVLTRLDSVAVALSGGVDSALVAAAAHKALGDRACAVTGDSPSVARKEIAIARSVAAAIGIRHRVLNTDEFANPEYIRNDGSRCYFCKSELYGRILDLRQELGFAFVCSGANRDDLGDYRPGLVAASERGIVHPLIEAGLGKAEVRALAQKWNLPVWDKPASPCLSSRIAPHLEVTRERTGRVEAAEDHLKELGFAVCRVRYFPGDLGKIEVPTVDLPRLLALREQVVPQLLACGFAQVEIDPLGFRSGHLNELIPLNQRKKFTHIPPQVSGKD